MARKETFETPQGPAAPMTNYDPIVILDDNTEEVVKVQAAGPVAAIYTAAMSIRREWPIEKQMRVLAITVPNASR